MRHPEMGDIQGTLGTPERGLHLREMWGLLAIGCLQALGRGGAAQGMCRVRRGMSSALRGPNI